MSGDQEHTDEIIAKIKELPIKERVKAVALYHHLQRKQKLEEELETKIADLQREYDGLCLPLYEKQNQIISGVRAPNNEELVSADKYVNDVEKSQLHDFPAEPLEDYWVKAFKTSAVLSDVCNENEKDWDVLKYLTKVELQLEKDNNNFTIVFTFSQNEYFTNTVLSKKFIFSEKTKEEPVKSESTPIEWVEGKNITVKKVTKKQKNKKTGASRTVTKDAEAPSFFNFFKDFDLTEKESLEEDELDKEEERMNEQFDLGTEFVESVIPCSLELYLGLQPELCELGDEDEDFDDEEEDEEEEEDDGKKKGGKKNHKKSGDNKGEKPDCKQQ